MATVRVPGATIYYEASGDGPPIVMIPGGPMDAGGFAALREAMAGAWRVVAYDPRGNSRSAFDGPPVEQDLDVHGDDAAAVIDAVGGGPVVVLGSSGGAQIGANLAARYPDRVAVLVAHEPPCATLLPDGPSVLREFERIYALACREGVGAAMAAFAALAGFDSPPAPAAASPDAQAASGRIARNVPYFLAHGVRPIAGYRPDVEALRRGRVVVGIGAESGGQLAHRCALALASALDVVPVTFPGGHTGFGPHAAEFARVLGEVAR